MSGYEIPFHIQEDIMKRLPAKSLVQFRCVSKAWKSLIDSSKFISAHSLHSHTQQQHLLVSYESPKYASFSDTFVQQRSLLTHPPTLKQLLLPRVIGSSHGLLGMYALLPRIPAWVAFIWNPSIRKLIIVPTPNRYQQYVYFGVCPVTNDPKILLITQTWDYRNVETSYSCKVMVYTFSSGEWRTLSTNLPTKPVQNFSLVVTDRFFYWRADLMNLNMIISFDVTNDKFETIDLPDSLARHNVEELHSAKLRDSLCMLQCIEDTCTVWMMEHGDQRSFTKLFVIETRGRIVGFRNSGVPILQVDHDDDKMSKLVVYEPNAEHSSVLETAILFSRFNVHSYTETLLLLCQSGSESY